MATDDKIILKNEQNPWKGLNFYSEGEVLYGRDLEIQTLSRYIINNTQTVLYGKSGIGKSSIINAGIFPVARREGLYPVALRLKHDDTDFSSYIQQIKQAFEDSGIAKKELLPPVDRDHESLWEYLHRHQFFHPETERPVRPLLVLDQFEEIFTLQRNEAFKKEFFAELADLINEVTPQYIIDAQNAKKQKDEPKTSGGFVLRFDKGDGIDYVHESLFNLVFVIREDFLSFFERYSAYIPAMKSNRYALLPINEEQAADIIMKPQPGLVSKDVAQYIIQKVTGNTDFKLDGIPEIDVDSAVLSLYLSRLYLKKGDSDSISRDLVDEFSEDIIKDFYEESVADIPNEDIETIEDQLLTYDGRRNNVSRNDLTSEGVTEETLEKLVHERKLLRQFSYQGDLRVEFMHDILCPIVDERINQRELAKQKELERLQQEEEKKKYIEEERKKREEIEKRAQAEKKRHEEETRQHQLETLKIKARNRKRIKWLVAAALALAAVMAGYLIYRQFKYAPYSCTYANFTTVNGWPVGVNEINPNDKSVVDSLIVYYRLTRYGRRSPKWGGNPFHKVEVISSFDHKPTTNKFIESPVVRMWETELGGNEIAADFAKLQRNTASWLYSEGDQGDGIVGKCTAFDLNGKELYSIQYNRDNTNAGAESDKYVQWAVFYDAAGKQMMLNDQGIDRMRQTISKGVVMGNLFFTMLGVPQKNTSGDYGYQYVVNDTTNLVQEQYCVDKYGKRIDSTKISYRYDHGRLTGSSLYDISHPQPGMVVYKYKAYSDTLSFYENGHLASGSMHFGINKARDVFKYNEDQLPTLKQLYANDSLILSLRYVYDQGKDKPKEIIILDEGVTYHERHEYLPDSTEKVSFWSNGQKTSVLRTNENNDDILCHSYVKSVRSDDKYTIETTEYRDVSNQLVSPYPGSEYVNQYSKYEIYKDKQTGNDAFKYYYDRNGGIFKSEYFEYDEYGNMVAQGVAGIDHTPVRCDKWSWDDLCCYKMAILKPFYLGAYSSLSGINEFGENSLIMGVYQNALSIFSIVETPMDYFTKEESLYGQTKIKTGFNLSETSIARCTMRYSAFYVHVLSRNGELYKAGLRDGDVIVSINGVSTFPASSGSSALVNRLRESGGCEVTVARADVKGDKYVMLKKTVNAGNGDAHVHQMELTKEENDKLAKSIAK